MKLGLMAMALSGIATVSLAQTVEIGSEEFNAAVRAYLMENPEVIFEAVDVYNARQAEASEAAAKQALTDNQDALYNEDDAVIILGDADAEFAIVEFIDYNCSFCRKSHEEFEAVFEANPDMKVLLRQLPILSQNSLDAARVVLAVDLVQSNEDAKSLHNYLYDVTQTADMEVALSYVDEQGWDRAAIEEAMDSEAVYQHIATTQKLAESLQISGTPGFVIGDELVRGYVPADQMNQIIDAKKNES